MGLLWDVPPLKLGFCGDESVFIGRNGPRELLFMDCVSRGAQHEILLASRLRSLTGFRVYVSLSPLAVGCLFLEGQPDGLAESRHGNPRRQTRERVQQPPRCHETPPERLSTQILWLLN
jgi:hypothetical protein